ncbi:hypothetical protein [Streptomyces halobius]|uniref:Lipoprotein n=1 Tax=Streptomyces halobius TaxID=2879846 RepID=A0ABY4MN49_9ACTN|nr:hypothetical protein [Streptomyces halobius]UQA97741.1 hypothetical protein K9S39_13955 [Streptomyces halobius]
MRRRTLLAGTALGGAALLAGCSEEPGPEQDEHSSAANRLRERSAADSVALLARYDATLDAHPDLEARLGPLRAEVARHADAFTDDRAGKATPSPGTTPSGRPVRHSGAPTSGPSAATGESTPENEPVPEDEKAARTALADTERKLADARTKALTSAPPELARLLASVAAAGATHAYLLTEAGA